MAKTVKSFQLHTFMAAASVVALLAGTAPTAAEEGAAQAVTLEAQPLEAALVRVGQQFGVVVVAPDSLVGGLEAPSVSGTLTAEEAIGRLLAGTSLATERAANGGFVVVTSGRDAGLDIALDLDPIVVQGELLERSVQDTLTSVVVVTGEELERRSDKTLPDVAERTAGISSFDGIEYTVRGINSRGPDRQGGAPLVSTTVDGARVSNFSRRDVGLYSLWDLEQAEILLGPQSTQTGRNALAGAVVLQSKNPSYDHEFKVRGSLAEYESYQGAVAVNLPLIEDRLAIRVGGDFNGTDGFVDNDVLDIDDQNKEERTTVRGSIRIDPTQTLSAVLKLTYFEADDGRRKFESVNAADFPDLVFSAGERDTSKTELKSTNLRLFYDLTDAIRIESNTTYFDLTQNFNSVVNPVAAPNALSLVNQDGETFEQELKVIYENSLVRAVFGGFYTEVEETEQIRSATLNTDSSRDTENFALFGEIEFEFVRNWRLILGGRYDIEELEVGNGVDTGSSEFDVFLPKVGLAHDLSEDVTLGFTYQRGYRAGGAEFVLDAFFNPTTPNEFDAEFTDNYELALRSQWLDGRLTVNANAFYIDWEDQQIFLRQGAGLASEFFTVNAGESSLVGGELSIDARPMPALEVYGSLAYVETEFEDFVSVFGDLTGNEFVEAPKYSATLGGSYSFLNGMFLAADANYNDGSFGDAQNTFRNDSRLLVNLQTGFEAEDWSVIGFVDNLFDVDYVATDRGRGVVTPGEPSTVGIIVQAQF
ncbi:MAG: TonB-dependent receptor [Pseudomonadota bacterium]